MYTDAATLIASRDLSPTRLTLPQDGSSRASGETYDLQGPVLIPGLDLFNREYRTLETCCSDSLVLTEC
jgi:hypothetical protein